MAPVGSGAVVSVTSVVTGFSVLPLNCVSNQPQKASTGPSSSTLSVKRACRLPRPGQAADRAGARSTGELPCLKHDVTLSEAAALSCAQAFTVVLPSRLAKPKEQDASKEQDGGKPQPSPALCHLSSLPGRAPRATPPVRDATRLNTPFPPPSSPP